MSSLKQLYIFVRFDGLRIDPGQEVAKFIPAAMLILYLDRVNVTQPVGARGMGDDIKIQSLQGETAWPRRCHELHP